MADKSKWQEARRQIIDRLDILKEYVALGLRVPNPAPNPKGWIAVHAIDREDRTPSAGINVGDGPHRGRYRDFAGGAKSINFFDFVVRTGRLGGDFKNVVVYYAKIAGVQLPSEGDDAAFAKMDIGELTFGVMLNYCNGKPGITPKGLKQLGAKAARWPKGISPDKQNHLIALPQYGSALLELDPVGYHSFTQNPRGKVRIYKGEGNPEDLRKTMQLGDYGLMNEYALNRLVTDETVKVVVSLEGVSDLACGQSIIPDDAPEVVVSTGGCSYHIKPEMLQRFAGKEVWIVRDVNDPDEAGKVSAMVDVGTCVAAGLTVRNIILPTRNEEERMDFRKWITEGGHTWKDFVELAHTFDPVESADVESSLSPSEALLRKLGITVVGEHEGTSKIEVFCDHTRKAATVYDIDKLTYSKLIQLIGPQVCDEHVFDGKEPVAGKSSIKQVRNAIAGEAATKQFSDNDKLGSGIWQVDGRVVIVKAREYGVVEPPAKIVRSHMPFYKNHVVDLGTKVPDWCDFGQVQRYLTAAQSPDWCKEVFTDAIGVFGQWFWKYKPSPEVVASLICCSWMQSVWEWRPEVAVTGASDSGKSLLLEEVLATGIFGPASMYIAKPTEAAIRQHMRHHSRILILDEFEQDEARAAVLKLLRTASRGGEVYRGTSDQKGQKYGMKHLVWMGAIELGLKDTADLNRVILLDLEEIPRERRGKHTLPNTLQLRDLGQRLMAVAIRYQKTAAAYQEVLKGQTYDGIPGRIVESFSIVNGMTSAIMGHSANEMTDAAHTLLEAWDFGAQQTQDESRLISEILTGELILEGGRRTTVNRVLSSPSPAPEDLDALHRYGLHVAVKRSLREFEGDAGPRYLFIASEVVRKQLLSRSGFANQVLDQYLMRVKGAIRDRQRLGGEFGISGISIPLKEVERQFKPIDDHYTQYEDSQRDILP